MEALLPKLKRLQRRLALFQWVALLSDALLGALVAACGWLLLARVFSAPGDPVWSLAVVLPVALALGTYRAWRRRPALMDAALAADTRLDLRERLTSALSTAEDRGPMVEALHRDAVRYADVLDVSRQFPFRPTRSLKWLIVPVVLFGLGYVLLPEMDLFGTKERKLQAVARQEALDAKAEALRKRARALRPKVEAPLAEADLAARKIDEIADQLAEGTISEKQALARMQNLAKTLRQQREQMARKTGAPGEMRPEQLNMAREAAKALEQGNMGKAAEALRELKKKIEEGELSEAEKQKLAEEMKALQNMVGGENTKLGAALAKALSKLSAGGQAGANNDLKGMLEELELSLEDMASALEQMAAMDLAMMEIAQWEAMQLGPSSTCRSCGKKLGQCKKGGNCTSCKNGQCMGMCAACLGMGMKPGQGAGLRGPGQGQGNQVGELPDASGDFESQMLSGPMSRGKMLASILQRGTPETGQQAEVTFVPGALVRVQQEAETALTQEEIPPDAKDFVRQYFGALEELEGNGGTKAE